MSISEFVLWLEAYLEGIDRPTADNFNVIRAKIQQVKTETPMYVDHNGHTRPRLRITQ